MSGYTKEEVMNWDEKSAVAIIHPTDIPKFMKAISKAVMTKTHFTTVYKARRKDGSYIWVKVDAAAVGENFHSLFLFMNFNDYTAEKEAEGRYQSQSEGYTIMKKNSMASFRFNLTRNLCSDRQSEQHPYMLKLQDGGTVDSFFENVSANNPDNEIKKEYMSTFNRENLLRSFRNGIPHLQIDHRYRIDENNVEWITTAIDMVENPDTGDVEGFIYALSIDQRRVSEMIINRLVKLEYDFIAFIDMASHRFLCFLNNNSPTFLPPKAGKDYREWLGKLAEYCVIPDNRGFMKQLPDLSFIEKELETTDIFKLRFFSMNPGKKEKYEKTLSFLYLDKEANQLLLFQRGIEDQRRDARLFMD